MTTVLASPQRGGPQSGLHFPHDVYKNPAPLCLARPPFHFVPSIYYSRFISFCQTFVRDQPSTAVPSINKHCITLNMLSFSFIVFALALPEMVKSQISSATYRLANQRSAENDGVLRCAMLSLAENDIAKRHFTVDASGNCLFTQGNGSQFERISEVCNIEKKVCS